MDDELKEPDEVSARYKVSGATLAAWRYRGVGPRYLKIGRHVRYRTSDLIAWEQEQAIGPDAA